MQTAQKLKMCNSGPMRNPQVEQILAVLQIMMDAIGVDTRSELANRAKLVHTTLTRIDADNPKPAWMPSTKTWMKLSKATGVSVTIIGDKIVAGGQLPSQSYIPQDPIEIKVRNFLRLLGPEEKKLLIIMIDTMADKIVSTKRS